MIDKSIGFEVLALAIILLYLSGAVYVWRNRIVVAGAGALAVLILAVGGYAVPAILQSASPNLKTALFWYNASILGATIIGPAWLVFAIQYTQQKEVLTSRRVFLLGVIPAITCLAAWTNSLHSLYGSQFQFDPQAAWPALEWKFGLFYWSNFVYAYAVTAAGVFYILRATFRRGQFFASQMTLLLAGVLVPVSINILFVFGYTPIPHIDLTPFSFLITGIVAFLAIVRFHFLDIVPYAREGVFETMPVGIIVLDHQQRVIDMNSMAVRVTGLLPESLIGQRLPASISFSLPNGSNPPPVETLTKEVCLESGEGRRYLSLRLAPISKQKKKPTGSLLLLVDITDQKQAEEAFREAEAKYHSIFENAVEGIFRSTPEGRFLTVNPAFSRMLGYASPEAMIAEIQDIENQLYADPKQRCDFRRLIEEQDITQGFECQFLQKDGSKIWVLLYGHAVRSPEGQVRFYEGVVDNITQRKHIQMLQTLRSNVLEQLSGAGTLAAILTVLVQCVEEIWPGRPAAILLLDDTERRLHTAAATGLPEYYNQAFESLEIGTGFETSGGMAFWQRLIIEDIQSHPDWGSFRQPAEQAGLRACWSEPILSSTGKAFGALLVYAYWAILPQDQDLRILEELAHLASLVIERKRTEESQQKIEQRYRDLYASAQRQAQEMVLLEKVRNAVARELDPITVIRNVVEGVGDTFGYTLVSLYLVQDETLVLQHQVGYDQVLQRIPITKGILGKVVRTGKPVLLEDVKSDPDFLEAIGGIVSEVCIPLFDRERVVGALNVESSQEMKLTEADLVLLTGMGESISIAIERARLVDELRKANDHLQTHLVEIQILQTELRDQAIRDPLTGLYNRRYLQETLEREIARAKREKEPVSIIVMDLDHFKHVNDTYGHKAGDILLGAFGKLLQSIIRTEDIICRCGGEEFVILMPGAPLEVARQRAESIRMAIEALLVLDGDRELHATASLGVAAYPVHGPNGEEVQIRADRALYLAKQTGRNRVVVYENPKMTVQSDAGGYDDQK